MALKRKIELDIAEAHQAKDPYMVAITFLITATKLYGCNVVPDYDLATSGNLLDISGAFGTYCNYLLTDKILE